MAAIIVKTQAELDAAIEKQSVKDGHDWIVCIGGGRFSVSRQTPLRVVARGNSSVVAWENSSVVAWENSSVVARENSSVVARGNSSVVAWENSSVEARGNSSVEAWENSSVEARENSSVVAWGNSSVVARENSSVVARGNSSVVAWENSSVEARENSSVVAWGNSSVVASPYVAVHKMAPTAVIRGGVIIDVPTIDNIEEWLDYWGVEVKRGIVTLYKAVDDNYISSRDFAYTPGTKPKCPDWEPHNQCGNGLHLTAHPSISRSYKLNATKYVAVPVRVEDLIVCHPGSRSDKVKAPEAAKPVFEVDRNGEPVESAQKEAKHD